MNITFDIKTLITLGGLVAVLGGFYYSTNHRLEALEVNLGEINQQLDEQSQNLKKLSKKSIIEL